MVRLSTTQPATDADLNTRIGIAFATRPRITWHDIQVSVRDGIVTLRGEVPTLYDRQLVVAVTQHVAGVFGIDDQLHVTESPQSNPAIASRGSRRIVKLGVHHAVRTGVAAIAIALATLTGCGGGPDHVPVHPTTGAIQYRGKPISGAMVEPFPTVRVNGGGWCRPASDMSIDGSNGDGTGDFGPCAINCTNGHDIGGTFPHPYYNTIGTSEPYSFHPGGANFCMGDGAVKWVNDSIDMREFARFVTRNGGEITTEQ